MTSRTRTKQVFVAYPYRLYRKDAYRNAFRKLERTFNVSFLFADEKITNIHILDKIVAYMKGADFSIFDITGWNPNVTLELGAAYGLGLDWFICFNSNKGNAVDVPSDIKGIDRVNYKNLQELSGKLALALEERVEKRASADNIGPRMERLRKRLKLILSNGKGFRADQLAAALETTVESIQVLLEPMIKAKEVRFSGVRRGRKYFLK